MQKQRAILGLIIALVIGSLVLLLNKPTQLGLDLQGGSQLTIQVKPTPEHPKITQQDIDAVQKVIENRINGLGVSEAVVQTAGQNQILVQLPGIDDPEQAERVLGGTAQLEFREQKPGSEGQFQVEASILKEKQLKQVALRASGDKAAIAANQAAIELSSTAIANLFEKATIIGKNLTDAARSISQYFRTKTHGLPESFGL